MEGQLGGSVSRGPTLEEERERMVPVIKEFRKEVDALIQQAKIDHTAPLHPHIFNQELEEAHRQVRISLTNAKMWAGKMLEALGNPFPPELADKAK